MRLPTEGEMGDLGSCGQDISVLNRLCVGPKSYLFAGHTGHGLVLGPLYFPRQICCPERCGNS